MPLTRRLARLLTLGLAAALTWTACGDEEASVAPEQRCAERGFALVAVGELEKAEASVGSVELEAKDADSSMQGVQALLELQGFDGADGKRPLIVRLYAGGAGNLLTRIERAQAGAALTLNVLDTTEIPAGNISATALDRYPCDLEAGTICVQVGEDTNNNGALDDQDKRVFNATGGSVTIEPLDFSASKLRLRYNVALGRNIIDVRSATTGSLAGCLDARYNASGESGWTLN